MRFLNPLTPVPEASLHRACAVIGKGHAVIVIAVLLLGADDHKNRTSVDRWLSEYSNAVSKNDDGWINRAPAEIYPVAC
jgi:hypothetical protein